jgi:hypothetical protein
MASSIMSGDIADGTIATTDIANGAVTGAKTDANTVQARVTGTCVAGSAMHVVAQGGSVTCQTLWSREGNAGTSPGTDFLGTTDNTALEFKVNGNRVWRLEPGAFGTPNVVGGDDANVVSAGVRGATIGGGGEGTVWRNEVQANFGVVGGGVQNLAAGASGTVAGGGNNRALGDAATVGGGSENNASASGATVAGGEVNRALGLDASVGGGLDNNASETYATIAGGHANIASSFGTTVAP